MISYVPKTLWGVLFVVTLLVGCGGGGQPTVATNDAVKDQVKSVADVKAEPKKDDDGDGWCEEHGLPDAVCTKCNPKLIAEFKKNGDWCNLHGLPKSQCVICDPSLKAKFATMEAEMRKNTKK